ncbi:hypothetical protein ACIBIZ_40535 [Nonomuraea spiralis]|uniref:Uncharacterized protein n=1 Tax=Nonomuraea spiralis TaxID=46182 RepID=A0ABV5I9D4_9ACTN|nr:MULTISPECIES: hypothetical protein [Nonomuraea]RSN04236.1 hypothetical protein DMB42_31675 [Nonomuraea sp. WAC 01424]GGT10601.1 hypothetical protein GCM10010176_064080 [Nonomuraea spiralis]
MSRSESLAAYLRAQARRRLDRVESNDDGRNARSALALLDAASYAAGLPDDDPIILMLDQAGCYGPLGCEEFEPGEAGGRMIRSWTGGEPHELLLGLPAAIEAATSA